ncbi:class II fructose-bisphosphate aldolase [Buchnera aphidicola]|uniref:class II fructose-bisphosphate aldolase n=1 Tax=Buchnera aphidicola TaxID=9 RepID=UPI0031B8A082
MCKILELVNPGVVTAEEMNIIFSLAKKKKFALPAVNCIDMNSINSTLETAFRMQSPVIIQFSYGGASFMSGLGLKSQEKHIPAILGAISGAKHVHLMAKKYKIPVILHTDHCHKKILPWINALLKQGKKHFLKYKRPLFSSHMIDLSIETLSTNLKFSKKYLKKLKKINMFLEFELGCTGGEEDGIDNTNLKKDLLYTDPTSIIYFYKKLKKISKNFMIAASFGNIHGVYQPGKVALKPTILKESQKILNSQNTIYNNPINFVFHGGSGTQDSEIQEAINYGVIKFNIDTDIQWATWNGILNYYKKNKNYLQKQLGNPQGPNQPNKKYYDPRIWIRFSQKYVIKKLENLFKKLNSINVL